MKQYHIQNLNIHTKNKDICTQKLNKYNNVNSKNTIFIHSLSDLNGFVQIFIPANEKKNTCHFDINSYENRYSTLLIYCLLGEKKN